MYEKGMNTTKEILISYNAPQCISVLLYMYSRLYTWGPESEGCMMAALGSRNDWRFELCMRMFSKFFSVDWTKSHKNKDILKGSEKKKSFSPVSQLSRKSLAHSSLKEQTNKQKKEETKLCMKWCDEAVEWGLWPLRLEEDPLRRESILSSSSCQESE